MIDMPTVPKGWRVLSLEKVAEINPRRTSDLQRRSDQPTTFVSMSAVDDISGTIAQPKTKPFSDVSKGYTYFEEGDVIFAKITPCMQNGKHAIALNLIDGIGFGSTEFHVIRPGAALLAEWVHFYIRQPYILSLAERTFTGTVGQQRVPTQFLADLPIPVPPLDEQKRIIPLLQHKLAAADLARSAALAQLEAARALPSAYLNQIFTSPQAQRWPKHLLSNVVYFQEGPGVRTYQFRKEGIKLLNVTNLVDGDLNLDNTDRYLDPEEVANRYQHFLIEDGDIILASSGASWGKIAEAKSHHLPLIMNTSTIRLRPLDETHLLRGFLKAFLSSDIFKNQIRVLITGSAQPNFGPSHLRRVKISVPPTNLQEKFVNQLSEQLKTCEKLIEAANKQYTEIELLSSALLRQAFTGEL